MALGKQRHCRGQLSDDRDHEVCERNVAAGVSQRMLEGCLHA